MAAPARSILHRSYRITVRDESAHQSTTACYIKNIITARNQNSFHGHHPLVVISRSLATSSAASSVNCCWM